MTLDAATREKLWQEPDWTCPQCGFVNLAIRNKCRNFYCPFDWNKEGEGALVGCFEVEEPTLPSPAGVTGVCRRRQA